MAGEARGSSTITQPAISSGKATIDTRSWLELHSILFVEDDVRDPHKLYQLLQRLSLELRDVLRPVVQCGLVPGNRLVGVAFGSNQTLTLSHYLGRPFSGWWCCRAQGAAWSGFEAALPTGVKSDRAIALTSVNAGTYDFWVF